MWNFITREVTDLSKFFYVKLICFLTTIILSLIFILFIILPGITACASIILVFHGNYEYLRYILPCILPGIVITPVALCCLLRYFERLPNRYERYVEIGGGQLDI